MRLFKEEHFVPGNKLTDWNFYKNKFKEAPYLSSFLEKWLFSGTIENPLEVGWFFRMYESQKYLNQQERTFSKYVEKYPKLFDELIISNCSVFEAQRKLASFMEEFRAMIALEKMGFKDIQKVSEFGDWLCEDKIISVKTKFGLDFNYNLIEDSLLGTAYIKENTYLRESMGCWIEGDYLNNQFIKKVLSYIRSELNRSLERVWNESLQDGTILVKKDDFEVQVLNTIDRGVYITEYKDGQHGCSGLEMSYKLSSNKYFNVQSENDAYFTGEGIDWSKIFRNEKSFMKSLRELSLKTKDYPVGWIGVPIHDKFQKYVTDNKDTVIQDIVSHLGKIEYTTIINVYPERYLTDMKKDFFIKVEAGGNITIINDVKDNPII